jgi:hypothetical protein
MGEPGWDTELENSARREELSDYASSWRSPLNRRGSALVVVHGGEYAGQPSTATSTETVNGVGISLSRTASGVRMRAERVSAPLWE